MGRVLPGHDESERDGFIMVEITFNLKLRLEEIRALAILFGNMDETEMLKFAETYSNLTRLLAIYDAIGD